MEGLNKEKRVVLFSAASGTSSMDVTSLYMSSITGFSKYIYDVRLVTEAIRINEYSGSFFNDN